MDWTTGLKCRLGGMTAPEQIISHGIRPVGSRLSAGLIINLAVSALATSGTDAASLAITEAASSRTTVRKTPVIRSTPLKTLIAIAALFRAPIAITAVTYAAVTLAAVFKAL